MGSRAGRCKGCTSGGGAGWAALLLLSRLDMGFLRKGRPFLALGLSRAAGLGEGSTGPGVGSEARRLVAGRLGEAAAAAVAAAGGEVWRWVGIMTNEEGVLGCFSVGTGGGGRVGGALLSRGGGGGGGGGREG